MKPREEEQEPIHWTPWIVAGIAVCIVMVALTLLGKMHKEPSTVNAMGQAPYAANLPVHDIKMSESVNFAGGKVTYIDGVLTNKGDKTVTAITAQTIFNNSAGEPPQRENLPLMLIRTHDPYVDTQPVSAAPIKPGEEREFRLIFDHVTPYWDGAYPEVRLIQIETR